MEKTAKVYLLHRQEHPWADYGDVLVAGITERLPRQDGRLQLERAGPFLPPISLSGDNIIVTDAFKQAWEASGLTGLTFQPVVKRHIVDLAWQTWDMSSEDPPELPESGEPEGYILDRPHDAAVAERMGEVWEARADEHAELERVKTGPNPWDARVYLRLDSWDGTDWFRARGFGFSYVSERAKAWLEGVAEHWVDCREALVK